MSNEKEVNEKWIIAVVIVISAFLTLIFITGAIDPFHPCERCGTVVGVKPYSISYSAIPNGNRYYCERCIAIEKKEIRKHNDEVYKKRNDPYEKLKRRLRKEKYGY